MPSSESHTRERLRIVGKVQGVGFRQSTREEARRHPDLRGYVKNEADGSVVVEVEGPKEQVSRLREWLQRGPPQARVDQVRPEDPTSARLQAFGILG